MLQEGDHHRHGFTGAVSTLDQDLAHLRRSDLLAVSQQLLHLRKQSVAVEHEVIARQGLERRICAVGHVDVQVHAARAEQCLVQFLDVVRGEDYDALAAAAGP